MFWRARVRPVTGPIRLALGQFLGVAFADGVVGFVEDPCQAVGRIPPGTALPTVLADWGPFWLPVMPGWLPFTLLARSDVM